MMLALMISRSVSNMDNLRSKNKVTCLKCVQQLGLLELYIIGGWCMHQVSDQGKWKLEKTC